MGALFEATQAAPMGRVSIISLLLLAALSAFFAPVGWSFDARNGAGDWLTARHAYRPARFLYATAALENDPRGRNNVAVIDYHLARHRPDATRQGKMLAARKAGLVFRELAGEGYAPGAYNQALMCFKCKPDQRGYADSKAWFERALALGDPLAPIAYALHLRNWWWKAPQADRIKGLQLLRELADAGEPLAAEELASYARGRDYLSEDEIKAYYAIAAEAGNVAAQEALGLWYDSDRQEEWLLKAAKQGSIVAMAALGKRYYLGDYREDAPDYESAAYWLGRAVSEARKKRPAKRRIDVQATGLRFRSLTPSPMSDINNSEAAAYGLALIYLRGLVGAPDMTKAEDMLRYAALLPWQDSNLILIQMEAERAPSHAQKFHKQRMAEATLHNYARDFENRFKSLRPYVERGDIRALTEYDLARWTRSDDPPLDRTSLETLNRRGANGYFVIERDIDLAGVDVSRWPTLVAAKPVSVAAPDGAPRILSLLANVGETSVDEQD